MSGVFTRSKPGMRKQFNFFGKSFSCNSLEWSSIAFLLGSPRQNTRQKNQHLIKIGSFFMSLIRKYCITLPLGIVASPIKETSIPFFDEALPCSRFSHNNKDHFLKLQMKRPMGSIFVLSGYLNFTIFVSMNLFLNRSYSFD